jgi:hypothetical protein
VVVEVEPVRLVETLTDPRPVMVEMVSYLPSPELLLTMVEVVLEDVGRPVILKVLLDRVVAV